MPRLWQNFRVPESVKAAYSVKLQPIEQNRYLDVPGEGIRYFGLFENVRN